MLGYSEIFNDRIILDGVYNPWFDFIAAYAFSMFVLGLFALWVHHRINDAAVYNVLALGLMVNGGFLLVFGRDPFPHPVVIVIFFASLFCWLGALVSILTVMTVQRLPAMGVPEKYVQDPDDHRVRPYLPLIIILLMLALFWLTAASPFFVLSQFLGDSLSWALSACMIVMVSVVAYGLLPMTAVRETALLGETAPPMELDDIFVFSGQATAMERTTLPIVVIAMWGLGVFFASHGFDLGNDDWAGAVFLLILAASIVFTEYSRAKRSASFEDSRRTMRNI